MSGSIHIHGQSYGFEEFTVLPDAMLASSMAKGIKEFIGQWLISVKTFDFRTSGSTGEAKIIPLHRTQLITSARATANTLGLKHGMSALLCINTEYIGGTMMLVRGMEIPLNLTVIPPNSDPSESLETEKDFDFAAFVPLQIHNLLNSKRGRRLLNRTKQFIIGGGALNPDLEEALQSIDGTAYSTYGMTETASHIALRQLNGPDRSKWFQPLPGVALALDQRDCLKIKGAVTNHQWLTTNDRVELAQNSFKWLGRADNVVNSGGVKIQIELVEQKLSTLLKNAYAVTGVSDKVLGEKLVLVYEGELNAEEKEQILGTAKSILPSYHNPRDLVCVNELPLLPSGKLDRQKLSKQVANHRR